MGVFYLAIPVGAAIGYVAGGVIGDMFGWRAAFLCCGAPGLLVSTPSHIDI
jgi:predicted MFS family arabinose efflux permease